MRWIMRTPRWAYGSKVGIDATRKWKSEGFERDWPQEIEMDAATCQTVDAKWAEYFGAMTAGTGGRV